MYVDVHTVSPSILSHEESEAPASWEDEWEYGRLLGAQQGSAGQR